MSANIFPNGIDSFDELNERITSMTEEQQNKTWEGLPEEAKVLARNLYRTSHIPQYDAVLDLLFGDSNLTAADSEPKRKFKVGDRVVTTNACREYGKGWRGTILWFEEDDAIIKFDNAGEYRYFVKCSDLAPDTEPTATEDEEKVHNVFDRELQKTLEGYETATSENCNDDWLQYRKELAKAIASAMIGSNYQSTMAFDVESFCNDVVAGVDGIVERLKESKG